MKPMLFDIEEITHRYYAEEAASDFRWISEHAMTKYDDPDFEFGKRSLNDISRMPGSIYRIIQQLQSDAFIARVETWTGIKGLVRDDGLWGGGAHVTLPGGYLAMHRDFNVLPTSYYDPVPLRRALNLIMYLTPNWDVSSSGELRIEGSEPVSPWFGSTVIFDPSETYHGHPFPYRGAEPRQSIAVYYYVREAVPQEQWRSTQYLALPWKDDTDEARAKRVQRADARQRYAKWWPASWDANGSPA